MQIDNGQRICVNRTLTQKSRSSTTSGTMCPEEPGFHQQLPNFIFFYPHLFNSEKKQTQRKLFSPEPEPLTRTFLKLSLLSTVVFSLPAFESLPSSGDGADSLAVALKTWVMFIPVWFSLCIFKTVINVVSKFLGI